MHVHDEGAATDAMPCPTLQVEEENDGDRSGTTGDEAVAMDTVKGTVVNDEEKSPLSADDKARSSMPR